MQIRAEDWLGVNSPGTSHHEVPSSQPCAVREVWKGAPNSRFRGRSSRDPVASGWRGTYLVG